MTTTTQARPCCGQALPCRLHGCSSPRPRSMRAGFGRGPIQAVRRGRHRDQGRGRWLKPSSCLTQRAVGFSLERLHAEQAKPSPCARPISKHVHGNPRRGDARCADPCSLGHVASGLILYPQSTDARRIVLLYPTAFFPSADGSRGADRRSNPRHASRRSGVVRARYTSAVRELTVLEDAALAPSLLPQGARPAARSWVWLCSST